MLQGVALMAACLAVSPAQTGGNDAAEILKASGVKGGIVVHLGCGDGRLTAALRVNDRYTVHGLDTDAVQVRAAREYIRSRGCYGPVSVEQWSGPTLPYADNLVNLIVVSGECGMTSDEMLRVLAPEGVVLDARDSSLLTRRKPRPANTDAWTHFLHDAGNNAVARDAVVGPPRALQWVAPPLWLRSHETPSGVQALVTDGRRIFYFFDEGLIGITDQRLPERWSLICRDAFNGRLLWKRPLGKWGWPMWAADRFGSKDWTTITGGRTIVPDQNQRRLVADGDRLYATLAFDAPLSILDAATGETLATVEDTAPAREIICAGGVVVSYSSPASADVSADKPRKGGKRAARAPDVPGTLRGVDGRTGKVLWKADIGPMVPLSLASDQSRVIYQSKGRLVARDLRSGDKKWEADLDGMSFRTLVAHDGFVVLIGGNTLAAHDAADGKQLWQREIPPRSGFETQDLFIINGVVWPGLVTEGGKESKDKHADALAVGYDLKTGEERRRVFVKDLRSPEHHHRCYRNKATERFIITSLEGAEFLDLQGDGHSQDNFVRGACKYGMMPANGLLYVPPDQCFCQPGAKLLGFAALAASAAAQPAADEERLERGPAYGQIGYFTSQVSDADDWPTFRQNAARHGSTTCAVSAQAAPAWRVKLGGPLTAPVAAAGRVYVAARDAHTVHALDANSGKAAWTFVAGGRIDSPPTIHQGLVLFGSADGRVYCLRAEDGALVWRFLAAPRDRRVGCFDQIESAWPVHGSVLVQDGVAYFTAGRSTYLDGGIRVYALDPATGKVLRHNTLVGPFPDRKTWRDVSFYITGANSDVLVSEKGAIFMRQKRLTPALEEVKPAILSKKGEADAGLHVFSTSSLLDDSWYNRAFWMYSKRWPGFQLANQAPKSGQLLVVDRDTTYAVHPFYRRNVHSPMFFPSKEGYLLFADRNSTEPQIVGEEGARQPVAWLPQSDYERGGGRSVEMLGNPAFGLDKMIGYTRADPPLWKLWLPVRIRAMVKAGDTLFVAGPPDELD
ncbi:MAG: PQQ-binding-like beta-propeller repeat protein, partial [Verrucomicrobiae bacterium]|nr:PQQ-binding-like beta-propeller repeat protein [Verrucomicrobiae bacterium]